MYSFEGNRVVRDTGSAYPIFQAPIGGMSRSQWAGAISAAGGMGLMETFMQGSQALQEESDIIRSRTNRPFGYHLMPDWLVRDPDHEKDVLDWLHKVGAPFVTIGSTGKMWESELDLWRYVQPFKAAGTICYGIVETFEEAMLAQDAGIDGLILSPAEAGGVRGHHMLHLFTMIQRVRMHTDLPIVASGGIADGRGMAGAFALGAEGILMGSRFMAAPECPIHQNYKEEIAKAEDIFYVDYGSPYVKFLAVRNAYSEAVVTGEIDHQGQPYAGDARKCFYEGRTDLAMVGAGESAVLIPDVKPVAEIINETIAGFWHEMDRLAALRRPLAAQDAG